MKANRLLRRPDYQSSLWVLPEFNANEDSCHQDGILCNNLLGKKEGFLQFRGYRGYHHSCPSFTARVSGHIHTQQNCQVGEAREGQMAVGLGTKKTPHQPKNSTLTNAERQEGESIGFGQNNGKQDSCHWLIPPRGKKTLSEATRNQMTPSATHSVNTKSMAVAFNTCQIKQLELKLTGHPMGKED
ncbi:hypothetical protein BTVI_93811 [Pitangus sulphuratus]|nr:hypothetical protein BTVI_93811 [Pitangus sulphuratus]